MSRLAFLARAPQQATVRVYTTVVDKPSKLTGGASIIHTRYPNYRPQQRYGVL